MTKLTIDAFTGALDAETLADEAERIAGMLREGYTSGEVAVEGGRGWWTTEDMAPEAPAADQDDGAASSD